MTNINDEIYLNFKKKDKNFSNNIFVLLDIQGKISDKFINSKCNEFSIKNSKFRKTLVESNWIEKDFNYQEHIVIFDIKKYDSKNYRKLLGKIINTSFDDQKPMWKLYFIRFENKTQLIFSCAHVLGDGYFLIDKLTKSFFDNPKFIEKKNKPYQGTGFLNILFNIYYFIAYSVMLLYNLFIYKKEEVFNSISNHKIYYKKLFVFNVKELKRIKNKKKISINDLVYSIVLKTLKKYSEKEKINLISTTLFNNRSLNDNLKESNNFGFLCISTNVNNDNIYEKIHRKFVNIKNSYIIPFIIKFISYIFKLSPKSVIYLMTKGIEQSHFGYSNIFSYIDDNTMDNHKVTNVSNLVTPYKYKLLFSGLSYHNKITLNITYKKNVIDYKKLKGCFKDVIKELYK